MAKRKTTQSKEGSWPPPMQASQENPGYMGPEWNPSLPIPGSSRPSGPRPAGPIWGPPPIGRPPGTFRPGSNPGGGAWRDGPGSGFDVLQNPFSTNPTRPFPFDPFNPWGPRIKDVGDFPFDPDRWVASQEGPPSSGRKKTPAVKNKKQNKGSKKSGRSKSQKSGSRRGNKSK